MKSSLLAFSIFCFAFICKTIAAPEPVLDISGKQVTTGVKYYILPVIRGKGGGLTVANHGENNRTCPLYVVQEKLEVKNGEAVTFTPYNAKQGSKCPQTQVWKLLKELTGVWFLATGGVEGNPSMATVGNWFKIEKADKDYVLSFCPAEACKCQTLCRELGLFVDDKGNKHLALSDQIPSFRVVFKRA